MEALDITKIRHDFPVLARMVNGKRLVYLDSASTSQKPMAMARRMQEIYTQEYAAIDYREQLGLPKIAAYELELTAHAVRRLAEIPGVRVLGDPAKRISCVSFVVDGKSASEVDKALDHEGIAVRSGKLAAQPYLKALGVEEAVRASFMFYNTFEEADFLAQTVRKLVG